MNRVFHGYVLDQKLYESARTIVHRARRASDHQPVVIKALNMGSSSPELATRLEHEFDLIRSLDAEGVVRAYELSLSGNDLFMVIEDFGGESLDRLNLAGGMLLGDSLALAIKLADLVHQIHERRVMHRDINPSNIVLNPASGQIKLIDFGISAAFSQRQMDFQSPDRFEGTLRYISPEQTGRVNRVMDYRTDLYSLGVTLYELLTGTLPFSGADALALVHAHIAVEPAPLTSHRPDLPSILSDIVLKLMAKNAEDRYQSALGLKADLERVKLSVDQGGEIESFVLGQDDAAGIFCLPQKLYGRETETAWLFEAYHRASEGGRELLILTGRPGTGKTALVKEVYRPITRDRGLFLSGKFEQFQRRRPYHAFVQALEELANLMLAEEEDVLRRWHERLGAAVGDLGLVLTEAVPALEAILGPQPPIPELGGLELQRRFLYVFKRFFEALGDGDRPIVLFLDDWQWADSGSALLLKTLMTDPDLHHLLLICAYRNNEIDPTHPFLAALEDLGPDNRIRRLELGPLSADDIRALLTDTLGPQPGIDDLTDLVLVKTDGNAFFAKSFLEMFHQEGLLTFTPITRRWEWDIARVRGLAVTDNVVDLLRQRLSSLSGDTQALLGTAACLGARYDLTTLALVAEKPPIEVARAMDTALTENLLLLKGPDTYGFVHDQIHQAAYLLIPEEQRPAVHLGIGRRFRDHLADDAPPHALFDAVDHLNLGQDLVHAADERINLAELNFKAGRRAKDVAVFSKAYGYFRTGLELLAVDHQKANYDLLLGLRTQAAETAYLSGDFQTMHHLVDVVRREARKPLDQIPVFITLIQALNAQVRQHEAVGVALEALALLGRMFPQAPGPQDIGAKLHETLAALGDQPIEALVERPPMNDPEILAAMAILAVVSDAAFHVRPDLLPLLVFDQVLLSIQYGPAPESPPAYTLLGLILCGVVGDLPTGYRFGRSGVDLLDRIEAEFHRAKTMFIHFNCVSHWMTHNREGLPHFLTAYRCGLETGDLVFAALAAHAHCYNALFIGRPLAELVDIMAVFDTAIVDLGQHHVLNYHRAYYQSVLNWIGRADVTSRMAGPVYDTEAMLPTLEAAGDRTALFVAYFCDGLLAYHFGRSEDAADRFSRAETFRDGATALFHIPLLNFYTSLIKTARYPAVSVDEKKTLLSEIAANQDRMKVWAENAPENHGHRYALVEAELRRIEGTVAAARTRYREAARLAAENGYLNDEALVWELSARFHQDLGETDEALYDVRRAYRSYLRWGAIAKTNRLKALYPSAFGPEDGPVSATLADTGTTTSTGAVLDTTSLFKAARIIAGEVHIQSLIEKMMVVIVENAGAGRGVFVENRDGRLLVQAVCQGDRVSGLLASIPLGEAEDLPRSVVNYAFRTTKPLLLEDAALDPRFSRDPYIARHRVRSVLCFPLIHQGELQALIYLENNLIGGAFTPARLEIMNLLAAQAAVSLQNALLVDTLEQKVEARTAELTRANRELEAALRNVKTLSGLLPICANCKKIRDDQGYWQQVERYVQQHSQAEFTHSICPDCVRALYPELAEKVLERLK